MLGDASDACGSTDPREVIREIFVSVVDEITGDGKRLAFLIVRGAMDRARDDLRVAERLRSTTGSIESALTLRDWALALRCLFRMGCRDRDLRWAYPDD